MRSIVTGSLAYDYLMLFPGYFQEHVLPGKTNRLSVSFLVDTMRRQRGGTAGNIAYSLGLLGENPLVAATAGQDFGEYRAQLEAVGVDTSLIATITHDFTSTCVINTDLEENQITAFYAGAMAHASRFRLRGSLQAGHDLVIISPNDPQAMAQHVDDCKSQAVAYIYDPGMQTPRMNPEELLDGIRGAYVLICNDYEFAMFANRTGIDEQTLLQMTPITVITRGGDGSTIYTCEQAAQPVQIPLVPARQYVNPTGAGDAYRAGLMTGLARNWPLEVAGRLASLVGSYAVEHAGPQEHFFTPLEIASRYLEVFGSTPEIDAWAEELISLRKEEQPI